MDYQGFLDAVRNLNENSYFYGNEVLYRMAAESDLTDKDQLAGMMWLIGRSYAASPQRRSYGTDKETNWPVRSDNDGRDQFFAAIAKALVEKDWKSNLDNRSYGFEAFEADKDLLANAIKAVLQFNLNLSTAIEAFDYATDKAVCTNHISFCSKFLHFYYPDSVFIIDTYAQAGATRLFNKANGNYICCSDCPDTLEMQMEGANFFEEGVYHPFKRSDVTKLANYIKEREDIKQLLNKYADRKQENASNYITHCVRSYILGCNLQGAVKLQNQLRTGELYSWPRLIDTVFLNIKGKLSKGEAKRYLNELNEYGNKCAEYKKLEKYRNLLEGIANGTK